MRKKILAICLVLITALFVFASCDFGANQYYSERDDYDITVDGNAVASRRVYQKILTRSVMITVDNATEFADNERRYFYSGIIVAGNGCIVTTGMDINYGDVYTVTVTSSDYTETVYTAKVAESIVTPERQMAVTVLKIDAENVAFDYVDLNEIGYAELGEELYTVACEPDYQNADPILTASRHLYSGTASASVKSSVWNRDPYGVDTVIKTNGSVNYGNYGGFLFNADGLPVGMIVDRIEGTSGDPSQLKFGIGLSISAEDIKSYINAYYELY